MISSLTVFNFQKYKKKTINFKPGVNCITGPSYAGKSTLFRALRWAATNRPSVKFNRRKKEWQSKTVFAKVTTDTAVVKRVKKPRLNEYVVNGKSLKAMGSEVPADVFNALRLNHINFQQQLDGPYWFTLPASQVAKNLNEIVNLSIIDVVLKKANQLVRDGEAEERILKSQHQQLLDEIESRAWIVSCRTDWKELRSLEQEKERIGDDSRALNGLIEEFHHTGTDRLESLLIALESLSKIGHEYTRTVKQRTKLNSLIKEYEESGIDGILDMVSDFEKLRKFRVHADSFAENRRTLSMYIDEYKENELEIEHWKTRLSQYETRIKTLKLERCKTCGQTLPLQKKSTQSR